MKLKLLFLLLAGLGRALAQNVSGDMALSLVLIENENWKPVAEGYQFTDAACSDPDGNFYFTDVAKGSTINKISADGKVSAFLSNTPRISGLKFAPDGRLIACVQNPKKQVVAFEVPSGELSVLADNVQPNDLAVSEKGFVYFTETGKGQVTIINPKGKVAAGPDGINKPNGITLSPDQGTLAVSEYGGSNVWVFRVEVDGSLAHGAKYIELRCPVGKAESLGDGMTMDDAGRYYVTSAVGIQMFDPTGRLGGVIANPQKKGTVSLAFAGPGHQYLYACSSDKVFRRKLKAKGVAK
jgi:enterochelin esterase family protein